MQDAHAKETKEKADKAAADLKDLQQKSAAQLQ
jgi:hypothetical protein